MGEQEELPQQISFDPDRGASKTGLHARPVLLAVGPERTNFAVLKRDHALAGGGVV